MKRLIGTTKPLWALALVLLSGAFTGAPVHAQDFPNRAVRMIVPFTPGGGTDIVSRIVGQRLSEIWGKPVLVENRPGVGGIIASELVLNAPADGYTLNVISPAHTIVATVNPKLSFDPLNDFAPVALMNRLQLILVSAPAFPPNNVKELIAYAKARPGQLNYASTGTGGTAHLAIEWMSRLAGLKMTHVPYKGAAPAYTDIMGGQVQFFLNNIISTMPLVKAGKLKALGVSGATRSVVAPDVPTISESGLPGFDVSSWFGIVVVAKTPRDIVVKLNRDIVTLLKEPAVRERMLVQGAEPVVGDNSPEAYDRMLRDETKRWAEVIKSAGIAPN